MSSDNILRLLMRRFSKVILDSKSGLQALVRIWDANSSSPFV